MTIEEQILDADGSCRDVNFPDVEREDALSLLRFVVGLGSVDSAYDDSGEPIDELQIEERLTESRSNTLVTNWILSGLVSHIQLSS